VKTIIFCFAGRRENLELQLPFIRRILEHHPNAEYHVWNLAKNAEDTEYVSQISGDRIQIFNQFAGEHKPWDRFNDVYRFYASPDFIDCRFVKIDDDVIFIQDDKLDTFTTAIDANPGAIISAQVINNGACTKLDPELWRLFQELKPLPLLDVHKSADYALGSHDHFLQDWFTMTQQPTKLLKTGEWLSINLIGYDYPTGCAIARQVGGPSPTLIAGRHFRPRGPLGDEGMCNTLPRLVMKGFIASHLTFGPQHLTDAELADLRKTYADVGRQYREIT
jgi:hypothetical protein